MNRVSEYADELEGLLCKYLNCGYHEFGVKANNNLTTYDWQSPIYFALGHLYGVSGNNGTLRNQINDFLGNKLMGKSIGDVVEKYEYYGFESTDEAFNYIENTIKALRNLLFPKNK